jgi:hypothetical protein
MLEFQNSNEEIIMALTQERLEYQRKYRKRTGYAASKKYQSSEKGREAMAEWRSSAEGKKSIKRAVISRKKRINSDFDTFASYMYSSLRSGAVKRDLAFNITLFQLKKFLNENSMCSSSGRPVTYQQGCPNKASIDRINNRHGYSLKNIRVVCQQVNYARNDMSIEEFEQMCCDVAANHGWVKQDKI